MAKRKGASRRADIPKPVLAKLNSGVLETATLAEGLAIDFVKLISRCAPKSPKCVERLASDIPFTKRMSAAGDILFENFGAEAYDRFRTHPSDTVRGWAAYALAANRRLRLEGLIDRIRPLADDPHFGVREWAWIAIRPAIVREPEKAIRKLTPWTSESSERLRRFASEATRPRGVWCGHITLLREFPEVALPLIEPLRCDESLYVQNSVGNWLNDAAKSRPEWVRAVCETWSLASDSKATAYICRRAQRSLST